MFLGKEWEYEGNLRLKWNDEDIVFSSGGRHNPLGLAGRKMIKHRKEKNDSNFIRSLIILFFRPAEGVQVQHLVLDLFFF